MKPFVDPALRPIDPPVNDVPNEPYLHETDIPKDSFEDGHETDVSVSSGAVRSSLSQPQPEQVVVDNKSIFRAEKILKRRKRKGKTQHYVKWLGYTEEQSTWEPEGNIYDKSLIEMFEQSRT